MNMDLQGLYGDFRKLTSDVTSIDEAIDLLASEFQIDEDEVLGLLGVLDYMVKDRFDLSKVKKKHQAQFDATLELMLDSFFFGMFISKNEYFVWPKK